MTRPTVTVQIDELDLRAVPRHRHAAVADAFVRELTTLIARHPADWASPCVQPGPIPPIDVRAPPHEVGAALAQRIFDSLSPNTGSRG